MAGHALAAAAVHGLLVADQAGTATGQDISLGHVLLQMVIALAVVVGGIWGFSKIVRRTGRFGGTDRPRGRTRHRGAVPGLTILSRQPIGKGKAIAVVRAGSRCFLVGISDSGLNPLGELEPTGDEGSPVEPGTLALPTAQPTARPTALPRAAAGTGSGRGAGGSWLEGLRQATVRR